MEVAARLRAVDGRRLVLDVEAYWGDVEIGEGCGEELGASSCLLLRPLAASTALPDEVICGFTRSSRVAWCGMGVSEVKERIRERVWRLLEEGGIARFPRPVYGRIPNFAGAERAAMRLAGLDLWRRARVVKVNPDSPQRPVRLRALLEGKKLIMPTPRLRGGFILLDASSIPGRLLEYASTIRGAMRLGRPLRLTELPRVDLVVAGSVAVDLDGSRLGKGGGYSELEYAILRELGRIGPETPVVTTVHDVQVLDERIPREPHDVPVDIIVTPTRVIEARRPHPKPSGIIWELVRDRLGEIPVLRELARLKRRTL